MKKIPSYVLNEYLKFDRKIYRLGRPISLRTASYFIIACLVELVLYFIPVIGWPIRSLPFAFLIMIPFGIAYLLGDTGTENRSPLSFFKTFFGYQFRKFKRSTYFKGKELPRKKTYSFGRTLSYKDFDSPRSEKEKHKKIVFQQHLTYRN